MPKNILGRVGFAPRHIRKVTRRDYCDPGSLIAYRIGGPNAGHTFYIDGDKVVTCQIPGPMFVHKDVVGVIGPEGVISLEVLKQELKNLKATNKARPSLYPVFQNLLIDKSAVIPRGYPFETTCGDGSGKV